MEYRYKHVAIIGLDGMGCFNKEARTPNMDRIFASGAKSFDALSLYPTISAQNWGAMLIGAAPEVHGLTNSIVGRELYKNKELPTVFSTVRKAIPGAVLCSVSNWSPINHGIIEHDIDVFMDTAPNGKETTDKVVACVLEKKPTLLFVQIDDPDEAGHHYGYGTEEQLETISDCDNLVGRIYEAYRQSGILDDTLFIAIADHGGYIKGHGGYTEEEKRIFFALSGKTVRKCDGFYAETKDINAIVRCAFGIPVPEYNPEGYSSQIPEGIFDNYPGGYIREENGMRMDMENRPTPDVYGDNGLFSIFEKDDIKLALFFDQSTSDETGKNSFTEHGRIKYYSSGVYGATVELGATGFLTCDDVKFGKDSFTVSQWLKIDDAPEGECFICGTKTMAACGPGFALGFTRVGTILAAEPEDNSQYLEVVTPFYHEVSGGWLHCIHSFDRKNMTVDIYYNFKHKRTVKLPESLDISFDSLPFTVGEDASGKKNHSNNFIFNMDDFFIFNRAFSESDVQRLKKYYGLE